MPEGVPFGYLRPGPYREPQQPEPDPAPEVGQSASTSQPDFEPEPEPESEAAGTEDYPEDGTIAEVKEWIGEDLGRAETAYDREQERANPRSTLIEFLESMLG